MFLRDISPKKAVKETSFTVARDIKFQLVMRALPLEHWNEVEDIRQNLVIPVGEKYVIDRVRRLATENVKKKFLKHLTTGNENYTFFALSF